MPPATSKHVLIADDLVDLAESLAELLVLCSSAPITIDVVHDGAQAVRAAAGRPPMTAILDIDMPVMNGVEAAEAIRRSVQPVPYLIAMTGDPANLTRLQESNVFDQVFVKPISASALLGFIHATG